MDHWLQTNKYACIGGLMLKPTEHQLMPGTVLSIQRGQAEAFCMAADDGSHWIIKKFHRGRGLDVAYLRQVSQLLPHHPALQPGTDRRILGKQDLQQKRGFHHSAQLASWLEATVLMPRAHGVDWASLADDLRDGTVSLQPSQRLAICRATQEVVLLLEAHQLAHRDLSCGNLFIDPNTWQVILIDYDSMFHVSLSMPPGTTCGTAGYAARFAWKGGQADATATWCEGADRFSAAILCTEFLVMGPNTPMASEGGMFTQEELCKGDGPAVQLASTALARSFPQILPVFQATLAARSFRDCPSPEDWLPGLGGRGTKPVFPPPPLDNLENPLPEQFEEILRKRRKVAQIWPAPALSDLPTFDSVLPQRKTWPIHFVPLPARAW